MLKLVKLTSGRSEACKGFCIEYKNKVQPTNGNYYKKWNDCRCSICMIYLKWDGIYCPCCGYRVRRRPRGSEAVMKVQNQRGVKRIE